MTKTLITAALPYANGPLHIGHVAGCYLPADIYKRYLSLKGEDALFICGTDEHGVAITIKAKNEGITPQQVVDKYHDQISQAFKKFNIQFDHFSRTSNPVHHQTAQAFFLKLYEKGVFEEIETEQFFDEEAGQFLADRYIVGTCPSCGNDQAYGDQCEKCGKTLSPDELINPRSTLSGATPIKKPAVNWFLPMNKIAETAEFKAYAKQIDHWKTNVKGQFNSWLKEGLQPRAMTRDLDWGIPVPLPTAKGKVLYVWFDAPIGYISATKEYFIEKGNPDAWQSYWSDDARLIHFIGKDNIVFHTIIFPMMLIEHGEFVTPTQVPANEFLNLEGRKLSTSRNWAVWLHDYLNDFEGKNDELRYTLTAIAPETKDSDFTWKDYQLKVNSELVAVLGNLVNRVMVLSHKYFEGIVPEIDQLSIPETLIEAFARLNEGEQTAIEQVNKNLNEFKFREAQSALMDLARDGNKFLAETEPWKLWKSDQNMVKLILVRALQVVERLSVLMNPLLPETSIKIRTQLGLNSKPNWADLEAKNQIQPGSKLAEPALLFQNITDEQILTQLVKLENTKQSESESVAEQPQIAPLKELITYDDFAKLDIRVGTILEAVKVPKADKLLQLTVDTGLDKRTVVSGIAEHYKPEEVIGKQVCILANLAPRKLRGIESQGMILMAESNGKLLFIQPEQMGLPGSVIS